MVIESNAYESLFTDFHSRLTCIFIVSPQSSETSCSLTKKNDGTMCDIDLADNQLFNKFIYPLQTPEKPKIFWCVQEV